MSDQLIELIGDCAAHDPENRPTDAAELAARLATLTPTKPEPVRVNCPQCGCLLKVPASRLGKAGSCPKCGHGFTLHPGAVPAVAPLPLPHPLPPPLPLPPPAPATHGHQYPRGVQPHAAPPPLPQSTWEQVVAPGPVYDLPPERGRERKKKYPLWVRLFGASACIFVLLLVILFVNKRIADTHRYTPKSLTPSESPYPTSTYSPYPSAPNPPRPVDWPPPKP